jgi:uncharacterized lipoprotein YmbA
MIKKTAIVLFTVLLIFGCFSSPYKRYFQINIENSNSIENKEVKTTVLIKDIIINEFYDDYRLVYRTSPYELNYYSYEFWIIKPDKLIRKAILDYDSEQGIIFVNDFSNIKPKYYINLKINAVEEVDAGNVWFGRLAMDMKLYDYDTGKYLMNHKFDDKMRLGRRKIEIFPKIISRILKKNIDGFIQKIKKYDKRIKEKNNDKKN